MMLKLRHTEMSPNAQPVISEIDALLLIDRTIDLVTPMCTQLTYEGLIDEIFGINNATLDLPEEKLVDPKTLNKEKIKPGAKKKIALNSDDKIFHEIRDLNLRAVSPFLNKKAKAIEQYYKDRHKAQTVSQLKDYWEKLKTFHDKHRFLAIRIRNLMTTTCTHTHTHSLSIHGNITKLFEVDTFLTYKLQTRTLQRKS
jgi:hypothetical protein